MYVELLADDPSMRLRKGDVLEVGPSDWDPEEKYNVIRRVSDGFDSECSIYKSQARRVRKPK